MREDVFNLIVAVVLTIPVSILTYPLHEKLFLSNSTPEEVPNAEEEIYEEDEDYHTRI